MTKPTRIASLILILASAPLFSGCATEPEPKKPAPAKTVAEPVRKPVDANHDKVALSSNASSISEQAALQDGIAAYNDGDYNGAIKKLNATEIWSGGSKQVQLEALKYMAFSYCVSSRQTLCKAQFEKALKLDPKFDLAPGEKGHPLWGRVFERVKKSKEPK